MISRYTSSNNRQLPLFKVSVGAEVKMKWNKPFNNWLTDPCATLRCRLGRVCKTDAAGVAGCVCGDAYHCNGHQRSGKKVCGSDGQYYPSHCELHRVACVNSQHITIDHSENGCFGQRQEDVKTGKHESSISDYLGAVAIIDFFLFSDILRFSGLMHVDGVR